jgi:DNA polymerase-3 subunit delta'
VGKKLTARELAKAVNCPVSGPDDGCDECGSCRKIDRGIHPDFFFVEPSKSSAAAKEGYIRIDDIRDLQKKLNYLPFEGKYKVVVIDSAERMNPQAANSFLKTLEEPPRATLIILVTANPHQLLPTIVSRCRGLRFNPLSAEAVKRILARDETVDRAELDLRAWRCRGEVARAADRDLLLSAADRKELLELVGAVSFDRVDLVFRWSKTRARETERIHETLDELSGLLRDLAALRARGRPDYLFNADMADELRAAAMRRRLSSWLEMFESVLQTKYALQGNLNAQLSLETMLLKFCDAA